jgi:hypothetical protein
MYWQRRKLGLIFATTLAIVLLGGANSMAAGHPKIKPPDAETLSAEVPPGRPVALNGSVYPKGHYAYFWFQWGPTTRYGHFTEPEVDEGLGAFGSEGVTAFISHIDGNTTYHFRLVAKNPSGKAFGLDKRFRTRDGY